MVDVLGEGANYTNSVQLNGNPAVRLLGNGATFINTDRGRVLGTSGSAAVIEIVGTGGTIFNQSGAVISTTSGGSYAVAIQGGPGDDLIVNGGAIVGEVHLGSGADTIDILLQSNIHQLLPTGMYGGSGDDTLILRGGVSVLYMNGTSSLDSFEKLVIDMPFDTVNGSGNNLVGLSGFSSVEARADAYVNFVSSVNADATITMLSGGSVGISNGSVFESLIGSGMNDFVSLTSTGQVTGSIDLAIGDDTLFLSFLSSSSVQPAAVYGGSGVDTLLLATSGTVDLDLGGFFGFEKVNGASNPSFHDITIRNADNLQAIEITDRDRFDLIGSYSPDAFVNGVAGHVYISADSEVGRYGFSRVPGFETDFNAQQQALIQTNTTVINDGVIRGDVQMYYGDDVYDGSAGRTGGTISGYAGNDILKGGDENNVIEGGYGADDLYGNGGDDRLIGGDGSDILDGGSGSDILLGGAGDDHVFFDVTDVAANVSGGSGNDVLVIRNSSAPVSFDLGMHGFEAAQRIVDDLAGNDWSQIEDIYTAQWQLTQQSVIYDNGSKLIVEFDVTNTSATQQTWSVFDGQSRLDSVDQYFDDGTRTFINLDQGNASFVSQDWFTFDAQGRLSAHDVQYDNGSRTFVNIDENNSQSWAQAWFSYDSQGRLDTQDVIYDDGSRIFYNYDQDSTQPFTLSAYLYDAAGNAYQQIIVRDNGTTDYIVL
ncbi:calcium-binding protein [Sphingobium algorifonticola]|uniref:calcium-binding protein n=1 Tax=Sphingobium algorifonticola TaxID=2008318 RepID=UPI0013E3446C|nr:hypothetical protein [Sphingobium algorifonticola]